jgi:hypothetical protein
VAVLSLSTFLAMTAAAAVAVTLAVTAAVWLRALRLARAPGAADDGLPLCFLAGLALGAEPVALLLCWPMAFLLWLWALRRGERWPLCGPLLGAAGAAVALYAVAAAETPAGLGALTAGLGGAWSGDAQAHAAAWATAREVAAQLGVVAGLVGVVGVVVLAARAPFVCALVLVCTGVCLMLAAGGAGGSPAGRLVGPASAAWAVLVAGLALPVAAGIAQMASKLGPARAAAAVVIAVVAAVSPALDGGARRWRRDVRPAERLIEEALAPVGPRAEVDPGSEAMRGLFRYAAALGVRPDVSVTPAPATARP